MGTITSPVGVCVGVCLSFFFSFTQAYTHLLTHPQNNDMCFFGFGLVLRRLAF